MSSVLFLWLHVQQCFHSHPCKLMKTGTQDKACTALCFDLFPWRRAERGVHAHHNIVINISYKGQSVYMHSVLFCSKGSALSGMSMRITTS
jgi:hypothetical protein